MVILTQFRPPAEPVRLKNVVLRKESLALASETASDQTFTGYELSSLTQEYESFDKAMVTVAEEFPDYLSGFKLVGLAELATGRWRNIMRSSRPTLTKDFKPVSPYPWYSLTEKVRAIIEGGIDLSATKRFNIAIERWHTGVKRNEPIDTVLDLCSSLEACFALGSELRLRLSFAVRASLDRDKRSSAQVVYDMYGVRNTFIHGSSIPAVSDEQRFEYTDIVSKVLLAIIGRGSIPSANAVRNAIFSH